MVIFKKKNRLIIKALITSVMTVCFLLSGSFLVAAEESSELLWTAADCSCVPEMPWVSYAFYQSEEEPEPAELDFSTLKRIAYYRLNPDEDGDFKELKHWDEMKFKRIAGKYETKIDLVVDIGKTNSKKEVQLDKDYILYELVSNIVTLVKEYNGNGIIVDFTGIPKKFHGRMHLFIQLLKKRLIYKKVESQLNVIFPYHGVTNTLDLDMIDDLDEYVDYYLIKMDKPKNVEVNNAGADSKKVKVEHKELFEKIKSVLTGEKDETEVKEEKTEAEKGKVATTAKKVIDFLLMRKDDPGVGNLLKKKKKKKKLKTELGTSEINRIAKDIINSTQRKKIIPVIMFADDNDHFEAEYDMIIKAGFGGVGLWRLMTPSEKNLGILQDKYVLPDESVDFVKWIMQEFFPSVCKEVCPNRVMYRTIFLSIAGIFLFIFILSLFFCEVNAFLKRFFWFYFSFGIALLLYFEVLCLCDPVMQGKRTDATLGLFLLVFIYIGIKLYQKRKEANFP